MGRELVIGVQRPRLTSVPRYSTTSGPDAVSLAGYAGQQMDPWQDHILDGALGERPNGTWSAFEVGVIVPRQNGKGGIIEARVVAGLSLFDEELILYSAHEFKTAMEAFRRVHALVKNTPSLAKRVQRIVRSTNELGIEFKGGQRLRFIARSSGAGRGFSGDCVILDEAYNLDDRAMDALLPTLSARSNPQIWYLSSAGMPTSVQLGRVRRRGLARDPGLAFYEWSVRAKSMGDDRDDDHGDPANWAVANPALGIRISLETCEREQRALSAAGFARERLGVGDYPAEGELGWEVFPEAAWSALVDLAAGRPQQVAFGFAVSPERDRAVIAAAGFRPDGVLQVEVTADDYGTDDCREGTHWVVPRLADLVSRWKPVAVVADPRSPAGALIDEAVEAGLEVKPFTTGDLTAACGQFFDRVAHGTLRHRGQAELTQAAGGARKRVMSSGAWAWEVQGLEVDGSPLSAVTLAAWGATHARAVVPLFARA